LVLFLLFLLSCERRRSLLLLLLFWLLNQGTKRVFVYTIKTEGEMRAYFWRAPFLLVVRTREGEISMGYLPWEKEEKKREFSEFSFFCFKPRATTEKVGELFAIFFV
jgi:hypothetical protein